MCSSLMCMLQRVHSNLGNLFFIDVNAVKITPLGELCVLH